MDDELGNPCQCCGKRLVEQCVICFKCGWEEDIDIPAGKIPPMSKYAYKYSTPNRCSLKQWREGLK